MKEAVIITRRSATKAVNKALNSSCPRVNIHLDSLGDLKKLLAEAKTLLPLDPPLGYLVVIFALD